MASIFIPKSFAEWYETCWRTMENAVVFATMTDIAEIEAAIEKLPGDQVKELTVWLEEYQLALGLAHRVFSSYDVEEGDGGDRWNDPA